MENENIKAVVDHGFNDDAVNMKAALYDAINDKIFAAIEQRKEVVAQSLVSQNEPESKE